MTTDPSNGDGRAASTEPLGWSGLPYQQRAEVIETVPALWGSPPRDVAVAIVDRGGIILSTNQPWDDFCLANDGDLASCGVGTSYVEVCRAAGDMVSARVGAAIEAAAGGRLPAPLTVLIPCDGVNADGTALPRWFDLSVTTRLADDGSPLGAAVALWPVPAPSGRSRLLPLSEGALDDDAVWELLEAAPDGTVLVDPDGYIAYVNRQLEALSGYERADLLGRTLEVLVPDDAWERHQGLHRAFRQNPKARMMGRLGAELEIRRCDATTLPVEISLAPVRIGRTLMTVASVRDVSEQRAQRKALDVLKARHATVGALVAEVTALVLSAVPAEEVYQAIVDGTRVLTGAERAGLVVQSVLVGQASTVAESGPSGPAGGALVVDQETLLSLMTPEARPATAIPREDLPEALRHAYGAGLVARFPGPAPTRGVLIALRSPEREPFDGHDVELLDSFAQQVAIVLELGDARAGEQRLALLEDRQRIARDLHDTVIQEVIGVGMQLAAMAHSSTDAAVRDRNDILIDQLDETVRRLRTVVFDASSQPWSRSVTETVTATIAEAARALGHSPTVTVEGDLDELSPAVAEHLVPVLREALSNVARHAGASSTRVDICVDDLHVELTVDDDGSGVASTTPSGSGLSNMRQRAILLGGTASLTPRADGGSRLRWIAGTLAR